MAKVLRTIPASKLVLLTMPAHPWSHIPVYFITDLPESQGNTLIIIIGDYDPFDTPA